MKSDRIYPVFVIVLILLLAGSAVLAYVFYQMLARTPAEGASADSRSSAGSALEPGALGARTRGDSRFRDTGKATTPGRHGGAGKWALRAPISTPVGFGPGFADWRPEDSLAVAAAYMGMALDFDDDCENYGGEYSLLAPGTDIFTLLTPGNVCLDVQRPEVFVPEQDEKSYSVSGTTHDACKLDRTVHMCYSLGELSPDARGRVWNPLYNPTARVTRSPASLLEEWHAPFLDEHDNSQEAQRQRASAAPLPDIGEPTAPNRNSYFRSNNPNEWFSDLPLAATATYLDIRPGVDLSCYVDQNRLEYVFTFWPGIDPIDVAFTYNDAQSIYETSRRNIAIDYDCATLIQHRPFAYKLIDDIPHELDATYQIRGKSVNIDLRDTGTPLTTRRPQDLHTPAKQPIVDYLSYLGGKGEDRGYAVAVDHHGYAYLAGASTSPDFAAGQGQAARIKDDTDAFVTKIRLSDRKVIYTTFLGGRHDDRAFDVAVDPDGNVYVCGETLSPDFATVTPPPGGVLGRAWDAFVVKLNPSGQIADFACRVGGRGDDRAFGIALDAATNVFIAGTTRSSDFPITEGTAGGGDGKTADAFVMKLSSTGKDIVYAARFGGSGDDQAYGLALDRNGSAVIVGETDSTDIPLAEPTQATHGGGKWDAFAAVFSADGRRLDMSTYLGGKGEDRALGVDVDRAHTVFITGETASEDFPTKSAVQERFAGGQWDAFLTRLDPVMHNVVYSTYLGGSGDDRGFSVAADASGLPSMGGTTSSTNLPMVRPLQDTFGGGQWDAFLFGLGESPTHVRYCTYLGGAGDDTIYQLAMEAGYIVNLAGATTSTELEVVDPLQSAHRGGEDVLAGRILDGPPSSPPLRMVPAGGMPGGPVYDYYVSTFEVDNQQFVNFLNDAQANPDSPRGTNMFFDAHGNVWMSPEMYAERDELLSIHDSRIAYDPSYPVGARYSVTPRPAQDGNSYAHHPAVGVSWYGTLKYCNWLTVASGRSAAHRCYREGQRPVDWAPVTCPTESWEKGIFTTRQRLAWLAYKGYRLPMDNCAAPPVHDPVYFRVTNEEFADFLNDVEANPASPRGTNVWFDVEGNAFYTPPLGTTTGRIFSINNTMLVYTPAASVGTRYTVLETPPDTTPAYHRRPVANVTWPGAMKYCNWLSLIDEIDATQRCYREGIQEADWSPITVSLENWRAGEFTEHDRDRWVHLEGYRIPFVSAAIATNSATPLTPALSGATNRWPNLFNEVLKTSGWSGNTNTDFGFGRNTYDLRDANYLDNGTLAKHDTTPVGFYNGTDYDGRFPTRTNDNLYGIYDTSGNASEWVSDPGNAGSLSDRAYYGGSWRFPLPRMQERFYVHPYFTESFMGFRVVTTATSENMHIARIPFRLCICGYGTGPGCGRGDGQDEDEEDDPGDPKEKDPDPDEFLPLGSPPSQIGKPKPPPPSTTPPSGVSDGDVGKTKPRPPSTTQPNVSDGDDGGGGNEMVLICHRPLGNPGNAQTISVPLSIVPAHLAHGDTLGPCP